MDRNKGLLWGILLLSFVGAFAIRVHYLSFVEVNSDSLSPYLSAVRFWYQGFSDPPNPESDHWMWVTKVPWVLWGDSLESIFAIRFFFSSLLAPLGAWCAYICVSQKILVFDKI